jgi:hypothetical protein
MVHPRQHHEVCRLEALGGLAELSERPALLLECDSYHAFQFCSVFGYLVANNDAKVNVLSHAGVEGVIDSLVERGLALPSVSSESPILEWAAANGPRFWLEIEQIHSVRWRKL